VRVGFLLRKPVGASVNQRTEERASRPHFRPEQSACQGGTLPETRWRGTSVLE